jgi:hypothetical protein
MQSSLTQKEIGLLLDKGVFKTKASLTLKLQKQLGELESLLFEEMKITGDAFAPECHKQRGKITKGENLNGLPWIVLDYPRFFSKQDICVVRTLIWWGKHISVSLLITGNYKKEFEKRIFKNLKKDKISKWNICISNTPWVHDFTKKNYCKVDKLSRQSEAQSEHKTFLKISRKISLKKIARIDKIGAECFNELTKMLQA